MTWLPLLVLHALSYGFSTLEVGEREVDVHLRLQMLSLVEVFPDLDPDLDGNIDAELLESRADDIASYVRTHWRLSFGDHGASSFEFRSLRIGEREDHIVLGNMGWVELDFTLGSAHRIDRLRLEVDLFESTSPGHSEIVHLRRRDRSEPDLRAVTGALDRPIHWKRPMGPLERWTQGVHRGARSWDLAFLGPGILFLVLLGANRRMPMARATLACLGIQFAILALAPDTLLGIPMAPGDLRLLAPLAVAYLACTALFLGPSGTRPSGRILALGWLPAWGALEPAQRSLEISERLGSATALLLVGGTLQLGLLLLRFRGIGPGSPKLRSPERPRARETDPEGLLCWGLGLGSLTLFLLRLLALE